MRKAMLLLAVFGLVGLLWAADPFVGTWELRVAKSKLTADPIPKSETAKIEAIDNGLKHTFDGVYADGKAYHQEWSAKFDGKDYSITGDPLSDTGALSRIDANTIECVFKKTGKEVGRYRVIVSEDGKSLTATGKTKNAKGQDITSIGVYGKQ